MAHAKFIQAPISLQQSRCVLPSRRLLRITHAFSGVITIYEPCQANEMTSLLARHLCFTEHLVDDRVQRATLEAFQLLATAYPPESLTPLSLDEVVARKRASLRKRALIAHQYIDAHGLQHFHRRISMFIKNERMEVRDTVKPPRAIQARSPEFTISLQRYIYPYSDLWKTTRGVDNHTPFMKGMNQLEIAQALMADWNTFQRPVAVLLDHKNFDAGVHTYMLRAEHEYYLQHYVRDRELADLLQAQLKSVCVTASGIKYTTIGTRASGDADTSDGNSTINLAVLLHLFRGVDKRISVIGDDSVVILSYDSYQQLVAIDRFNDLGQLYVWDTPYTVVTEFEHIEFCQCRPVLTCNGWLMVRTPSRVLTRSSYCIDQRITTVPQLLRWLRGVGLCEQSLNQGVPILQAYAEWCMSGTNAPPIYEPGYAQEHRRLPNMGRDITIAARATFYKAFGISIDLQLLVERYFSTPLSLSTIQDVVECTPQSLHSIINA